MTRDSRENERLVSAIGMMGSSSNAGDGEGVAAYRQATRMLAAQGLTWRDVAQRAFGTETAWSRTGNAPTPAPTPASRSAETRTERRGKDRVDGCDVPVVVTGVVALHDAPRDARRAGMIIFQVENDRAVYGPLVAYAEVMERVIAAGETRVTLRTRPARRGERTVQATACTPA